jgi:valyl-tRNA synthetase
MSEIPKAYEPQAVEEKWYQFWLDQKCFVADPARVSEKRPGYSIVIPPPNVTGVLHMGHVLNNTIQDILARKARMDGKEVLWLPGTDHAGIATEGMVSKQIWKEEKKTKRDLGREEFIKRVWAWKEKHGGIIISQLKKLGCSCDWTRERFTMDPDYVRNVQRVFVDLYRKGLIYRGKRMVNWCPATLTALSDEEVDMESQKGFLYYFKVEVVDSTAGSSGRQSAQISPEQSQSRLTSAATETKEKEFGPQIDSEGRIWLTIATTRPETIPGDTAVAVNPKDPRYAHLIGKHVLRPLPVQLPREQKLIPIIGDEYVDFEFGTGVLKVTPAHDKNDFAIGQRHNLPAVDIMNPNGTMNELAGESLAGLDRFEARAVAVERLKELDAIVKEEPYENKIGISQRARVPIEPRLSEQWFLKYPAVEQSKACVELGSAGDPPADSSGPPDSSSTHSSEKSVERVLGGPPNTARGPRALPGNMPRALPKMRFHPQRWAKVYDHWLANIQDWCISRQLWWGHRIPVWYSDEALKKLSAKVPVIEIKGNEIGGANIKELRDSAWKFAAAHAFLNHTFRNDETGWYILVRPASLEHAFTHQGPANTKAIVALPELIRTALKVGTLHHVPPSEHFKCVHLFVAAARVGGELFRVKITVKEHLDGQKLYDHQLFKISAPDGESPTPAALASEPTRPASGADIQITALFENVNTDTTFTRCQPGEPGPNWTQDPDVLDTWFSSWLWPFATMGWTGDKAQDSKNPTLQAFYPTDDLVTAPEIIFFWVARMIMAGFEYMGDLPFRNVYFTGIVRDKQGRKMSKSLGNSPDPVDLIAKYGADAVRFGTMRSAPLGQDVLFDEKDVELGRNFCNKLWNACRFRQMQSDAGIRPADQTPPGSQNFRQDAGSTIEVQGEINPSLLTNDDKWILLKLSQAIKEITASLAEYKFNEATATLYRFFWSEYCDWYVEASKAALSSSSRRGSAPTSESGGQNQSGPTSAATELEEARRANTLAVIDFVLSHTLRLFHPFLPFITEELWHGMGYATDMPEDQGGRTIMTAPWPKPFEGEFRDHYGLDDCYLDFAQAKYDLVSEGRNLRRIGNIPASKKVRFIFKPADEIRPHDREVIKLLLNAEALEINADYQPKKGTPTARTALGDLFLPLEGLVDVDVEKARLKKEVGKAEAEIAKVEQKLANPNFTQKVPPQVLLEHQQRLAEWLGKRDHAQSALKALEG